MNVFRPGDKVVRNPATWHLQSFNRFPDLQEPRAGFGVGTVHHVGWSTGHPDRDPPDLVVVRWGEKGDANVVYHPNLMVDLLPAPAGSLDDPRFADLDFLWDAVDAAYSQASGSRITALIDELRPRYAAWLAAVRRAGGQLEP